MGTNEMRAYIAAPWVQKEAAIEAANKFTAAGFEVVSKWFEPREGDMHDPDTFKIQADNDLEELSAADVLVVLNLGKSEGKAVEQGYALAIGIPIVVVGERSIVNIFQYLDDFRCVSTIEEAIKEAINVTE